MSQPLNAEEEARVRDFYERRTTRLDMSPSVLIPRLLATLDAARLLADTPSVEPRACGCPATDANGFARTCSLPLDHAGMHSARDTAGTSTGEATWLWNGPHGLAYRASDSPEKP